MIRPSRRADETRREGRRASFAPARSSTARWGKLISVVLGGIALFVFATSRDGPEKAQYPTYDDVDDEVLAEVQDSVSADAVVDEFFEAPDTSSSTVEDAAADLNLLTDDIFVEGDSEKLKNAPIISVMEESSKIKYRSVVLEHERFYRSHEGRLFVPRIRTDVKIKRKEFNERFAKNSQPVIVPYESMRDLGFSGQAFRLERLAEIYPNRDVSVKYKYGSQFGSGEIDLGPAVTNLMANTALKKTKSGRNFPRNMKVPTSRLSKLQLDTPQCLLLTDDTKLMLPSVWFGTPADATKFHADCCDNYAFMISGIKKWTVAPPSEARILHPKCMGGLCWVKSLEHPDEHAKTTKQKELRDRLQKVSFELKAGEMLFLPTGWFHHVENEGPTIMVNYWAKGLPAFVRMNRDKEQAAA